MNQSRKLVFLDTDILISAYEDSRCKGILDHASNHDGFLAGHLDHRVR